MEVIIIIVCIYVVIKLSFNNGQKEQKRREEAEDQRDYYFREIERLKLQIQIYKKNETANPLILSFEQKALKKENLFKDKKALVGDYFYYSYEDTRKILTSLGMSVDIVFSGEDIVDRIEHGYQCDIIFTNNIYDDGTTGEDVLKRLKKIKNFNTPIVILTLTENQRDYFVTEIGFDEYLEKQFTQKQMKSVLKKLFKDN